MASLYKRGKHYWVSYYLDGQHVQKSLKTTNQRVAESKVKRLEYELALGDLHVASKTPLAVILEAYGRHLKATRTFKSYKNDFSRLRVFFGPICQCLTIQPPGDPNGKGHARPAPDKYAGRHVKARLLEDVSPELINRFLAARTQRDGWSAKTANLMRQTLHALFAYAIKHHGFRSRDRRYPNPAAGVERRREPAPQIRFLTAVQIAQQLAILEDRPAIRAQVALYIYAGLRREEGLWLTHEDVDLDQRLICVRAKTVGDETWQPKTKANRIVPISTALYDTLRGYQAPADSLWYFTSTAGTRWNPDNFSKVLSRINTAANLPWSCGDYRHTFGSQLAQKGESLYKIATLMGNSPEICRRHYAALIPGEMADTVEFVKRAERSGPDDETKGLLKTILHELRDGKEPEKPRFRIVRPEDETA